MPFRYECYTRLKDYAGRVCAIHEVIELAAREFAEAAHASPDQEEFISRSAKKHGLHVHFPACPDIVDKAVRLHMVNVLDAFEQFLADFRKEQLVVPADNWKDYSRKGVLEVTALNLFGSEAAASKELGELPYSACEYYRLVRHQVVHSGKPDRELMTAYETAAQFRSSVKAAYPEITNAPNPPDSISRDDFLLFIRASQDVAWRMCQATRPTDQQLMQAISPEIRKFNRRFAGNSDRLAQAVVNTLVFRYGLSAEEAVRISCVH